MNDFDLCTHYIVGGTYAKEWKASRIGESIEQHEHNYDHLSYLARGSVYVEVEGQADAVYHAPIGLTILAGKKHKITAGTDDVVWLCIHAIPEGLRDETEIKEQLIKA